MKKLLLILLCLVATVALRAQTNPPAFKSSPPLEGKIRLTLEDVFTPVATLTKHCPTNGEVWPDAVLIYRFEWVSVTNWQPSFYYIQLGGDSVYYESGVIRSNLDAIITWKDNEQRVTLESRTVGHTSRRRVLPKKEESKP